MTAGGGAHLELMTLRCFSFAAALALVACGGDDDRSEPPEATAGAEVTEGEVDVVMSEVVDDTPPPGSPRAVMRSCIEACADGDYECEAACQCRAGDLLHCEGADQG